MKCYYLVWVMSLSLGTPGIHPAFLDYPKLRRDLELEGNYLVNLSEVMEFDESLKEGLEYQELPTFFPEVNVDWRIPVYNEYPFAAFIYGENVKRGQLKIGSACAAGILTYTFLITDCACLEVWYHRISDWEHGDKTYSTWNPDAIEGEIYVTLADKEFVPNMARDRKLKHKQPMCGPADLPQCILTTRITNRWSGIAVVEFEPSFKGELLTSSFVPWPPARLPNITHFDACAPWTKGNLWARDTKVVYITSGLNTSPEILYNNAGRKLSTTNTLQAVRGELLPIKVCVRAFKGWKEGPVDEPHMVCVGITPEFPIAESRKLSQKISTIRKGLQGGLIVSRHGIHAVAVHTPPTFLTPYILAMRIHPKVVTMMENCANRSLMNIIGEVRQGGDYPRNADGLYEYDVFKPDLLYVTEPPSAKPKTAGRGNAVKASITMIVLTSTILLLKIVNCEPLKVGLLNIFSVLHGNCKCPTTKLKIF